MAIASNSEFITQLVKLLGLPRSVIGFELRAYVDEAVTVKCEFYPEPREVTENGELVRLLGEYELIMKRPPVELVQESFDFEGARFADDSTVHDTVRHFVRVPDSEH